MRIEGGSLKMEEKTLGGKIGVYLQWSKTAFLVKKILEYGSKENLCCHEKRTT